jgi:hypothetical protein
VWPVHDSFLKCEKKKRVMVNFKIQRALMFVNS